MIPSCDQTGVPLHFHSSTASGSACLMSSRILLRVFPRQSASSAILFEMSSDAEGPWFAFDFFMLSPKKLQIVCAAPSFDSGIVCPGCGLVVVAPTTLPQGQQSRAGR